MKNVLLICRKELKSYFASPIAYAVLALFAILFAGVAFYPSVKEMVQVAPMAQQRGQPINLNEMIRGLLGFVNTLTLFLLPLITMRLFAEEKRQGTMELLMTSPVRDFEIIIGKWLGAMLLYLSVLLMSALNLMFLFFWGKPDLKPVLVAYLGLALQGACLLAIGEFISSITKNQIVAGVSTFFVCLTLFLLGWFTQFDTSLLPQVANYLAIVTHFENFAKGVIDLKDVVYYVTFSFLAMFVTARAMESQRWRA
jgi:ABC-2 type transport system permease protein